MGERRDTEKRAEGNYYVSHYGRGAIELERSCKAEKIPGRIIPVPRELSAGCGLAWCSPEGEKGRLGILLKKENVEWEDMVQMLF